MIIGSLRGKRSKGKGREFRRKTGREGEGRRGTGSPSSFLARPSCFSLAQNPLSLPFGTLATRGRLSLKQWETNGMFVLVTSRFLSNLPVTLIVNEATELRSEVDSPAEF